MDAADHRDEGDDGEGDEGELPRGGEPHHEAGDECRHVVQEIPQLR